MAPRFLENLKTPRIRYVLIILHLWRTRKIEKITEEGAYDIFSLPKNFRTKTRTVS
jgi:hypothetical protein